MARRRRRAPRDPVAERLAAFFHRNGYVRWQRRERAEEEGWGRYKKGDELRLVANTASELREIRELLEEAGFRPGRPFQKGSQFRVPVYGRDQVARFLELIGVTAEG
ncbi:MAG: hypothetical protein D6731_05110 [Planctomycetota bacterium]|nr:MAG: hypothetical protein D6731_05110 [Planctomycetota bacterium]